MTTIISNSDEYYNTTLETDIIYIKGVGPARGKILKKNNISSVGDLIYHFPRKYLDRTTIKTIRNLRIGDEAVILGQIDAFGVKPAKKRRFFQLTISDSTGKLNCVWFRGISWISDKFQIGDAIAIFGKVEFYNGLKIIHPEFDLIDEEDPINTQRIIPLYPSNQELKSVGLDSRGIRRIIINAFEAINNKIDDFYNPKFLKAEGLHSHYDALEAVHQPNDKNHLNMGLYRLKFDELFFLQLLMGLKKIYIKSKKGKKIIDRGPYVKSIYDNLSFELTNSQIKVLKEIRLDLKSDKPMNRLIQGDVGSGKTIVAVLASSIVIGNNFQVAMMAPTEILAEQHYISFQEYFEKNGINCELLIGALADKEKNDLKNNLKNGVVQIIVGTHALIQKDVKFKNLGMIIIDEQHRFGVEHRKLLIEKGYNPEILAMTATPIPRTLAFAVHGDMDISIIDELPKNRIPIITKIAEPKQLDEVYAFMNKEMKTGRQCFVVYPLIEESEKLDLQAAEVGYNKLKKIFKDFEVGYIHGRMKKEERDMQMQKMLNNEIQCLVSTTVIEVGVNIPNSTIMLIENAERFGLTQLHQLRGRIGRGSKQSYCVLVKRKSTDDASLRLNIMEKTNDGFIISDEDLKLRGPGEFFGTKQHGHLKSKLVNYMADSKVIKHARDSAFNLVRLDPELNDKQNKGIKLQFLRNYKSMLEFVNIN
tara:strand:- start:1509 stop:3617 length:2109 start_codon:yes stop_codon:yes gene_type:complete